MTRNPEASGIISLRDYLHEQPPMEPETFVRLAKSIAESVSMLHARSVIHLDLRPEHILIFPETMHVQLAGQPGGSPAAEAGLPYCAPENTGRMRRGVDERSDLYSLGVIYYEMATGMLPFQAAEPLEWIHAHLALPPLPMLSRGLEIPEGIHSIVMRLLEKNAERRYRDASFLIADLDKLGEPHDPFLLKENVHGREQELSLLTQAFQSVCFGSTEIVYVSGEAGIGKTSVIEEVFRKERHSRSFFYIAGKFEQIPKDSPYHPIILAFRGLMRHLLGESLEKTDGWRQKLRSALGSNAAVIGAIIPEAELLIGESAVLEELPPDESKKRFIYAFRKFVQVFAAKEHPLVLFIDDLQWADSSSLQLIHALLSDPECQYLMFVGAYRDQETDLSSLPGYEEGGSVTDKVIVRHIHLPPLTIRQMNRIVRETLRRDESETMPLTELLYHKSGGNPFHFKQLFMRFQDDRLLVYNYETRRWQWNLGHILEQEPVYEVRELMLRKLQRLPERVLESLQYAACLGSMFTPARIADVSNRQVEDIRRELEGVAAEGIVLSFDSDCYHFVHDNVQKLLYNQMDDETRRLNHLKIGRSIWQRENGAAESSFDAVNHLNIGSAEIRSGEELRRLIAMNLDAGKQAKASSAYDIALLYFRKGVELLKPDHWEHDYALCFELQAERAECEYLCGHHELAEPLLEYLLQQASNRIERSRVQLIRISQLINRGLYNEATMLGLQSLKEFHISVPPSPRNVSLLLESLLTEALLRNRLHKLADLPEMTDKHRIAAMNLIFAMVPSTFFTNKKVYFLLICKAIQLSCKYGNTPVSAAVYSAYGMILGLVAGKPDKGYAIAKAGLELSERYGITSIKSKTHTMFGGVLCQFVGNASDGDEHLLNAIRYGLESGDYIFSSYAMGAHVNSLYTRAPLSVLAKTITDYLEPLAETKDEFVLQNFYLYRQLILALQGATAAPDSFDSDDFRETDFLERIHGEETASTTLFQYGTYKTQLCFLSGRHEEALRWAERAMLNETYATHLPHLPECVFYESLAIAAAYRQSLLSQPTRKRIKRNLGRLRKWARWSPGNYLAKLLLAEAEFASARKQNGIAEAKYDAAIREAREYDNIQVESVACELAANYHWGRGRKKTALAYLQAANDGYNRWGVTAKTGELGLRNVLWHGSPEFACLQKNESTADSGGDPAGEAIATGAKREPSAFDQLDLSAILRATQAITNQVDLDAVLKEIMSLVMKVAGARKGALFTGDRDVLRLQAYADPDVQTPPAPAKLPDGERLPESIVRYVFRTEEAVEYNGTEDSWLIHNPYIAKHRPQSMVCSPVTVHGAVLGVLYLENDLAGGVFTPERMEVLKALASHGVFLCILLRSLDSQVNDTDAEKPEKSMPDGMEEPLTDREMEVLALLAAGLSNKEIAERLVVAVGTVKVHVKNIFAKLKVNRRTKAVAQAKELQLLGREQ